MSAVQVLESDQPSDWGVLPAGVKVVHAHYLNLVFKPETKPRWYTPSTIEVSVPIKHLTHTAFEMELAVATSSRPSAMQSAATAKEACVLSELDHFQAFDGLSMYISML